MSHSAKKNEREGPLVSSGFVGYVKKVQNERKGGSFGDKNFFQKKSHNAERNRKGRVFQSRPVL